MIIFFQSEFYDNKKSYLSNLTQSFLNIFFDRTFNKHLSIDDMKNYYELDNFTYLVVKANDLYFEFDLSEAKNMKLLLR